MLCNSVLLRTNVHHFRATLRKAKCAANLDPRPILVSQWPARMLAPFPARRAYIQLGLELDEDCGSDVFLLLSR